MDRKFIKVWMRDDKHSLSYWNAYELLSGVMVKIPDFQITI